MMMWTKEKANEGYNKLPWLVGCNFIPSSAVNQLEMWQEETFDPETIRRELGWAADIGFNTVRVFLHDLAWLADAQGFRDRVSSYLDIAAGCGISTMFVFFDDCWNTNPKIGKQPDPRPGIHNSMWVQSPGKKIVKNNAAWQRLEDYIRDVIGAFATDERVLAWDVYNEPGNTGMGERSLGLLGSAFKWAREAGPSQPLTAGVWANKKELKKLIEFQTAGSDIITFHNYNDIEDLKEQIKNLKAYGRPVVCTEYMARVLNSRFGTHMPVFKQERVGCYSWGLVAGRTQTNCPWRQLLLVMRSKLWFHDIFYKDGTPYDAGEVEMIKKQTIDHRP